MFDINLMSRIKNQDRAAETEGLVMDRGSCYRPRALLNVECRLLTSDRSMGCDHNLINSLIVGLYFSTISVQYLVY